MWICFRIVCLKTRDTGASSWLFYFCSIFSGFLFFAETLWCSPLLLSSLHLPEHHAEWLENQFQLSINSDSPSHDVFILEATQWICERRETIVLRRKEESFHLTNTVYKIALPRITYLPIYQHHIIQAYRRRWGKPPLALVQCFSKFVRPRPGKFFFHKTRARSQQIYS